MSEDLPDGRDRDVSEEQDYAERWANLNTVIVVMSVPPATGTCSQTNLFGRALSCSACLFLNNMVERRVPILQNLLCTVLACRRGNRAIPRLNAKRSDVPLPD